jgi:hypothetical protein
MPDLKTEMQKVLEAWETPEPTETIEQPKGKKLFKPTNNVSQETFNFIRDNAGCARGYAITQLTNKGHKKSSVSSLVGQMIRQGHITKNNYGMLYANGTEYTPIKSAKTAAKREAKVKKVKSYKVITPKAETKGIDTLVAEHAEVMRKLDLRPSYERFLDDISLSDAHALYCKLHQYFGGLPK